ncbi:SprT family zinc-dependent metalloprotease [Chromatiaceae bacterium AAb-1]|nr:SprT family zinc-dependent metalloprotease [Chromatiaceae bacterium AAb-1]
MAESSEHFPFRYRLIFSSRRRTLGIRIKQSDVTVSAPTGCSMTLINRFIAEKQFWIQKHLQHAAQTTAVNWLERGQLPLLDEQLMLVQQRGTRSAVQRDEQQLYVTVSGRVKPEHQSRKVQQLLHDWYRQYAGHWFGQRVAFWAPLMQVKPAAIKTGQWKTKWGYCNHKAELGFNWRLLMAPAWVADYVVVHELAHIRHMNHSPAFWQLVHQFYSQADEARKWLKHHQHQLEI